jgi:hypothetical protein
MENIPLHYRSLKTYNKIHQEFCRFEVQLVSKIDAWIRTLLERLDEREYMQFKIRLDELDMRSEADWKNRVSEGNAKNGNKRRKSTLKSLRVIIEEVWELIQTIEENGIFVPITKPSIAEVGL